MKLLQEDNLLLQGLNFALKIKTCQRGIVNILMREKNESQSYKTDVEKSLTASSAAYRLMLHLSFSTRQQEIKSCKKTFLPSPSLALNNYIHLHCEFADYTTYVDCIIFADMLLSMIKSTQIMVGVNPTST